WLTAQPQVATLQYAVAPAPPLNSLFADVVVLKAEPGSGGEVQSISALAGSPPFLESAISAVKQWKFAAAHGQERVAPVSVTVFYRARQTFSTTGARQLHEWPMADTLPPLPRLIVEPSYPVDSVAEGVVVLELTVSAEGNIQRMDTIRPVPSLTEVT